MMELARYRLKARTSTIKRVRNGEYVKPSYGSIRKTNVDYCLVLTSEDGNVELISKSELKAYLLMGGAEIDYLRDLPLHNSIQVKTNEDFFVLVCFASCGETINVKRKRGVTETVTVDEGDAIVYSTNENGTPDMDSVRCIKKEIFLAQYEAV